MEEGERAFFRARSPGRKSGAPYPYYKQALPLEHGSAEKWETSDFTVPLISFVHLLVSYST